MSIDQTTSPASARFRLKRPAVFVTAGLVAAALALGGPLVANAAAAPTLALSVATASASGWVGMTGTQFGANESIAVTLDAAQADTGGTPIVTDASGALPADATVYLPDTIAVGPHTITVTGATSNIPVTETITVVAQPILTISTTKLSASAVQSTGVTATVRGFLPGQSVVFGIGTSAMGDDFPPVVANAAGTATYTYVFKAGASFSTAGAYSVRATSVDRSVMSQLISYTVVANSTVSAPVTPATPATPVKSNASFTG